MAKFLIAGNMPMSEGFDYIIHKVEPVMIIKIHKGHKAIAGMRLFRTYITPADKIIDFTLEQEQYFPLGVDDKTDHFKRGLQIIEQAWKWYRLHLNKEHKL